MNQSAQPWFHSWYLDFFGLHAIPLTFGCLALFEVFPFGKGNISSMGLIISWILIIDWAHIFAQWMRIYSNPVESRSLKWIYPLSYLMLIPIMTGLVQWTGRPGIETLLIYFVIYHFIKQNFGYTRIYAKADGLKSKGENLIESSFIYLSMATPVCYWHISFPYEAFTWNQFFIKSQIFGLIFPVMLFAYIFCFLGYAYLETKRTIRNRKFNWPKNIAILAAAAGWGMVSVLSHTPLLIYFTVVLAHDVSYTVFVWLIGRRDRRLLEGKVSWLSWFSSLGLVWYLFLLIILSQLVLLFHHRLVGHSYANLIFGNLLDAVKYKEGWWNSFGVALFFSTQAHHYFIDRFLWKKEKDLEFMMRAGKFSLPS